MRGRTLTYPLAALAALQVADVVTTYAALRLGGIEANPVGRAALAHGFSGVVLVKVALFGLCVLAAYCFHKRNLAARAFYIVTALGLFYCAVVCSNLYQIGKM